MKGTMRWRPGKGPNGGAFSAQVYAGNDPVTGREIRLTKTIKTPNTKAGRKEAEAQLAKFIVGVEEGSFERSSRIVNTRTMGELLDAWFEWGCTRKIPKPMAPTTRATRRSIIKNHLKPFKIGSTTMAEVRATSVTQQNWQDLFDTMEANDYDVDSIYSVFTMARAALNWAMKKKGWISSNPLSGAVTIAQPENAIVYVPEDEEVKRLLKAAEADDPEFAVWLALALSFGSRRGTLAGLRIDDLDLDGGFINFVRALSDGGSADGGVQIKGLKADNPYTASLTPLTITLLREQVARRRLQVEECGQPWRNGKGHWLFSPDGVGHWNPNSITKKFRKVADSVGLTEMTLHQVKHYAVSRMLSSGKSPYHIAMRTGTSERTIERKYRRFIKGTDLDAGLVMDDLFER